MQRLILPLAYIALGAIAFYFQPADWPVYFGPLAIGAIGLLHLALLFYHFKGERQDELATLRTQISAIMRNQRRLDDDIQRLRSALSNQPPNDKWSGMMAEVKVLQNLIEQLYHARQNPIIGSPRSTLSTPSLPPSSISQDPRKSSSLDEEAILDIIKKNIRDDQIELALQPIVALPQRRRVFYECYSRLRTDSGQLLVPEHYLKIAESHQLIGIIDNALLLRCIQLLRRVQKQEKNVGFFLNISLPTLRDRRFFEEFLSIMSDNVMLAPSLVFELPQRALSSLETGLGRDLEQLARMGYRFSLDQVEELDIRADILSEMGFRFMKIGAKQLLRLNNQNLNAENAQSPQDVKRKLDLYGIDLIVEHVENERDLVELLEFDMEFGQGYLFGPPRLPRQDSRLEKFPF